MININGNIIANIKGFRASFDMEAMLQVARLIAIDQDIFAGDDACEQAQDALREVVTSNASLLANVSDGRLRWRLDTKEGALMGEVGTPLAACPESIGGTEARRLLLCQLGAREYAPATESVADVPHGAMHEGEVFAYELADATTMGTLRAVSVLNLSAGGESGVTLNYKGHTVDVLKVPSGCSLTLLVKGSRLAAVLPPVSGNKSHALCSRLRGDRAEIVELSYADRSARVLHSFPVKDCCQVCADTANGFVALVDGRIHIQSHIVDADAADDLGVPPGETVVMIAVTGAQLMALTDAGRTYSNFPTDSVAGGGVLRIAAEATGRLVSETGVLEPKGQPFAVVVGGVEYRYNGSCLQAGK